MTSGSENRDDNIIESKHNADKVLRITIRSTLLISVAIGLFGYAAWQIYQKWNATNPLEPLPLSAVQSERDPSSRPDEHKPDVSIDTYEVAVEHPRRIVIDSLAVNGFVQQVGLTKENAVDVPGNVHVAGWFNGSALPGASGLSIVDGHVSGIYSDGIFYDLQSIEIGAKVQLEFGDRSMKTFEVVEKKRLPEKDSAAFLFSKDPNIDEQLNLITCGGEYDKSTEQYADRIVVVTKLLQ